MREQQGYTTRSSNRRRLAALVSHSAAIISSRGMLPTPGTKKLPRGEWSSGMAGSPTLLCKEPYLILSSDHSPANLLISFRIAQDYPPVMREQLGSRLPAFTEDDFALLREADIDFCGMNYYTAQFARHRTAPPPDTDFQGNVDELPVNKEGIPIGELSGSDWLRSSPKSFRKHLVRIYRKYGKPICVTENGCPCPGEEKMSKEESVDDEFRQRYF